MDSLTTDTDNDTMTFDLESTQCNEDILSFSNLIDCEVDVDVDVGIIQKQNNNSDNAFDDLDFQTNSVSIIPRNDDETDPCTSASTNDDDKIVTNENGRTLLKCLICTREISFSCTLQKNSSLIDFQSSLQLDSQIELFDLSKVLKISPTIYQGIDISLVPTPMYCSVCSSSISQCLTILDEIENLQCTFDKLVKSVKDNLVNSYHSQPKPSGIDERKSNSDQIQDENQDQDQDLTQQLNRIPTLTETDLLLTTAQQIRKTFVQCLTKCEVNVVKASAVDNVKMNKKHNSVSNVLTRKTNNKIRKLSNCSDVRDINIESVNSSLDFSPHYTQKSQLLSRSEIKTDFSDNESIYIPEPEEPDSPFAEDSDEDKDETKKIDSISNLSDIDPDFKEEQVCKAKYAKITRKTTSQLPSAEIMMRILTATTKKVLPKRKQQRQNPIQIIQNSLLKTKAKTTPLTRNINILKIKRSRQEGKNFRYHCDICGKGYQKKHYLDIHKVCHNENDIENDKNESDHDLNKFKSPISLLPEKLKKRFRKRRTEAQKKFKFIMMTSQQSKSKHYPFKCKTCGKGYQLKHYLEIHEKCHRGEVNVPCPVCPEKFASLHYSRLHQFMAHSIGSQGSDKPTYDSEGYLISFKCNFCTNEYCLNDYLIDDKSSESTNDADANTKILKIDCDQENCRRTFNSFRLFHWHHRRTCSSKPKIVDRNKASRASIMIRKSRAERKGRTEFPFKCESCGKGYLIERFLKEHEKVHRGELDFPCSQCEEKFPCSKDLHLHEVMLHQKPRMNSFDESGQLLSFFCSRCNKEYSRDTFVNTESGSASGELTIKCEIENCEKVYPTMRAFHQHHQYHHESSKRKKKPQNLICNYCGKHFRTSSGLKDHEIKAHTEKWKFFCEICGKGCSSLGKLNQHKLNHTGEKRYECDQCSKCFKKKLQLTDHINKHNNYFPYVCDECGKSFVGANGLRSHKYYTHQKKAQRRYPKGERIKL